MHIQRYQIHNVLNVYRRQLSQGKSDLASRACDNGTETDSISNNTNNLSIMDKVVANVLKKITNIDPGSNAEQSALQQLQNKRAQPRMADRENEFLFNTIAKDNQKETRSISVDDSKVLMDRLDELAKAAVYRKNK